MQAHGDTEGGQFVVGGDDDEDDLDEENEAVSYRGFLLLLRNILLMIGKSLAYQKVFR